MSDRGPWLRTFTGRQFYPLDPRPEDVCIADIAHALSQICRFGGHTRVHYSVAEHSVRVADLVEPELALVALLHDAAEAYVVDIPRPLKSVLRGYKEIETLVAHAIGQAFGVDLVHLPYEVKHADRVMLATEARDLMNRPCWTSLAGIEPSPRHVQALSGPIAKDLFLGMFRVLTGSDTDPAPPHDELAKGTISSPEHEQP